MDDDSVRATIATYHDELVIAVTRGLQANGHADGSSDDHHAAQAITALVFSALTLTRVARQRALTMLDTALTTAGVAAA